MSSIYRKAFVFEGTSFEEYQDGKCIRQGRIACTIKANMMAVNPYNILSISSYNAMKSKVAGADVDGGISFVLSGDIPSRINPKFNLPIMESGDYFAR